MSDLLKNLQSDIKKNKLKSSLYIGLSAYWGVIIIGTIIQFN